jgi:hypothetical protein
MAFELRGGSDVNRMIRSASNVACMAVCVTVLAAACSERTPERDASARGAVTDSAAAIWHVQEFRRLVEAQQIPIARAFMSSDPRVWYEERNGLGEPWDITPGAGRWDAWDEHFRSHSEEVSARGNTRSVTLLVRETNDYYRLLDRGAMTTELVYSLDTAGKIDGLLVRAVGERPQGRTAEFLAWAQREAPQEIEYLRPGGAIDPTGDRAPRFRALLERWRAAAGLPKID